MKPYHLTPGASQGNAFTRAYEDRPSIFAERAKPGPGTSPFRVNPPTTRQLEGKQQITYSKARAR